MMSVCSERRRKILKMSCQLYYCLVNLVLHYFQHGGDVNAADHAGQTALHWSAVRGAIQVAEVLLQEGAVVSAADMYGYQVVFISFPAM